MYIVDRKKIDAVYKGFRKLFDSIRLEVGDEDIVRAVAYERQTPDFNTDFVFTTRLAPGMKPQEGEFDVDKMKIKTVNVRTKRWFDAIQMMRDDLEDFDRLNLYRPQIRRLAESYRDHRAELVASTLEDGWATNGFDGVPLFSNSHPLENGTNDNLVDAGGTGLTEAVVEQALVQLSRMKDDSGKLIGLRGTDIIVPPELEFDARKIVNATLTGGGNTNVFAGRLNVITSPYLTAANRAYVMDSRSAIAKPVFLAVVQPPRLELDDTRAVLNDLLLWVVKAKYNTALGLYHYVVGIDNI
ncbi:MAG: hypothetical protein KatS3mg104_2952 [Phycisphaerae bacterium]|nr:MAG: hypothetical protein KatS3mg104_2952 [Phycisphaerae bacterium]